MGRVTWNQGHTDQANYRGFGEWGSDKVKSNRATAGNAAFAYTGAAEDALNSSVNAAKGAYDNALGLAGSDAYKEMMKTLTGNIGDINATAGKIGVNADKVGAAGDSVLGMVDKLDPFLESLKGYAGQVGGQGENFLSLGQDIMGSWDQFKPMVGDYVKSIQGFDPNNLVAGAASDVQASMQNAQDQNQRGMSRMGVDPSSGAFQAQKGKWDRAMAVALSGTKTKARQDGQVMQNNVLAQGLAVGQGLLNTGVGVGQAGVNALGQAGNLVSAGADITGKQGDLMSTAGGLYAAEGQLNAEQINAYLSSSNASTAMGQIMLDFNLNEQSATNMLIQAKQKQAQYYNANATGWGSLAGSRGLADARKYG